MSHRGVQHESLMLCSVSSLNSACDQSQGWHKRKSLMIGRKHDAYFHAAQVGPCLDKDLGRTIIWHTWDMRLIVITIFNVSYVKIK
uniref:Uncharacterized protein n=1 Tax=Pararge aegeria TaxID=116150 RepID=S4PAS1_9NEOP